MSYIDDVALEPTLVDSKLNQVLDFAFNHISQVPVYAKSWPDEIDAFIRLQDKIIAETALLSLVTARIRHPGPNISNRLSQLIFQLNDIARSERHRILLLRYPQTFAPLGLAHAALTVLGYPDFEMHQIVMNIIARDLDQTMERIPYRLMEMRWVRSLIQPESVFFVDDLLPYTIVGSRSHPVMMSREDVYAITHVVMYSTDFGTKLPPPGVDLSAISSQIDSCIAWMLATEDLDLLLELILAATYLRIPWSPYVQFAWRYVVEIWSDFGFLHSPTLDTSELQKRSGMDASAYIFRNIYHTMYVGGLLCSALIQLPSSYRNEVWSPQTKEFPELSQKCRSAAEKALQFCHSVDAITPYLNHEYFKDVPCSIEVLSDLLTYLEPSHTRWKKMLNRVPLSGVDKARIIADCTIIHAIRAYDLPKLLKAINEIIKIPGSLSTTVLEAIDFLLRQQFDDGAIGAYFTLSHNRTSQAASEVTQVIGESLAIYSVRLGDIVFADC